MITANCKSCHESFLVSDETMGQNITCPACGMSFTVETEVEEVIGPRAEVAWEYTVLMDLGKMGHVDDKKLNKLGRAGWELVSVFKESLEGHTCFYFKRPLKPDAQ